ncbi:HAD hydrolase-like protein [Streptomyces sp. Tue 6075]|uniref:HAD hydrolase-like protein n=1 Tax=Streptomyces sp. Tue 6075 TaxID=1661694 RepID=UPI0009A11A19|nr:HAD hydrolase-like protein [Streptomyces sp. Tue 6075]
MRAGDADAGAATGHLIEYVNVPIGGYTSDSPHRPNLVGISQSRAVERHGKMFGSSNTVIIGDSLQDVTTGIEAGAKVIGVTSGTTSAQQLADAGAHLVIPGLRNSESLLSLIRSLSSQWHLAGAGPVAPTLPSSPFRLGFDALVSAPAERSRGVRHRAPSQTATRCFNRGR